MYFNASLIPSVKDSVVSSPSGFSRVGVVALIRPKVATSPPKPIVSPTVPIILESLKPLSTNACVTPFCLTAVAPSVFKAVPSLGICLPRTPINPNPAPSPYPFAKASGD